MMSNDILTPDYSQMLRVFISRMQAYLNACAGLAEVATTFSSLLLLLFPRWTLL